MVQGGQERNQYETAGNRVRRRKKKRRRCVSNKGKGRRDGKTTVEMKVRREKEERFKVCIKREGEDSCAGQEECCCRTELGNRNGRHGVRKEDRGNGPSKGHKLVINTEGGHILSLRRRRRGFHDPPQVRPSPQVILLWWSFNSTWVAARNHTSIFILCLLDRASS